jgi:hypothetical protein
MSNEREQAIFGLLAAQSSPLKAAFITIPDSLHK